MTNSDTKLKNRKPLNKADQKRKRIPLEDQKKIGIEPREGYHRRLVNDVDGRIDRFKKAGYTIVEGKVREGATSSNQSSQLSSTAKQPVGNGIEAVYMEIPLEWYEEDQRKKQDKVVDQKKLSGIDKIPEEVRRGEIKIDYGPVKE